MKTLHATLILVTALIGSAPAFAAKDGGACSSAELKSNATACEGFFAGDTYALMLAGFGAIVFIARRRSRS